MRAMREQLSVGGFWADQSPAARRRRRFQQYARPISPRTNPLTLICSQIA
jgi:hypothetical protein